MLISFGEARNGGADRRLAWSLAGVAGALNTAGFYAAGLYSSNMTGNVSALADHLGLGDVVLALTYAGLVLSFVSGAALSTLLINAGRRRAIGGVYALSILAEAMLLIGLAGADLWITGVSHGRSLAFGLSFLMGLQNAVVTGISNARVRTTHVTGMVTDIGIEFGNLLDSRWHWRRCDNASYNLDKLRLHGLTVLSFMAGGIVGVVAYRRIGPYFLLAVAVILLALVLPGFLAERTRVRSRRNLG